MNHFNFHDFMLSITFILAGTCIGVPLSKKMGLGSVIGYLLAGVALGPFALGFFENTEAILHIAEIGVVFLLFVIGLELNLSKLWSMRHEVFLIGGTQVTITGLLIGTVVYFFFQSSFVGLSFGLSLMIGFTLALSSTAFAMQLLHERNEFKTSSGQLSFSILLFQDLAAIPLIAGVGLFVDNPNNRFEIWSVIKPVAIILGVVFFGRYLMRYAFRFIAEIRIREVFTSLTLLVVIGTSLLMQVGELSMALGAFLAGVILADSEYRHELEADIQPFKGLFLGLFFIAVGMNINLKLLGTKFFEVLGLTIALMMLKFSALILVGLLFKRDNRSSLKNSMTIAQAGEFGFVIFGLFSKNLLLKAENIDYLTLVVTLSMTLSPFLLKLYDNLKRFKPEMIQEKDYDREFQFNEPEVIIAGFGRFGQMVARVLQTQRIAFTTLEQSPSHVEIARKFGNRLYYGDATRVDLLEAAGAEKAKLFVIAIDDVSTSIRAAKIVQDHFPHLKILARARNRQHTFELMKLGVTVIKRETFASALELANETLRSLGYGERRAQRATKKFREYDEQTLLEQYEVHEDENLMLSRTRMMNQQLEELLELDQESQEDENSVQPS